MKFLLKQFVGVLATPLMIGVLIALLGLVCRLLGKRRLAASAWVVAVAVAYLGSLTLVGDALLRPLEQQYMSPIADTPSQSVVAIVVLGSSYRPRDGVPVTGALDQDGLARITEGLRLATRYPAAKLIVSGGARTGEAPPAEGYARLARELGFGQRDIQVLSTSLDTRAEAREVVALLGNSPFFLVTSAYHMPRAMRLMARAGARPLPAPTGHRAGPPGSSAWIAKLVPNAAGLNRTERALHEYLGLAAMALRID